MTFDISDSKHKTLIGYNTTLHKTGIVFQSNVPVDIYAGVAYSVVEIELLENEIKNEQLQTSK